jgi:hypothetical protein
MGQTDVIAPAPGVIAPVPGIIAPAPGVIAPAPGIIADWPVFDHKPAFLRTPLKTKQTAHQTSVPAHPPMLLLWSSMEHTTDACPLSTVQRCVVNALAAGSTLTDAAKAYGVHRVTDIGFIGLRRYKMRQKRGGVRAAR